MKYKRVMVVWDDAVSHGDGEGQPTHAPWRMQTIGWLLKRDKHGVSVCSEIAQDHDYWREESFIPAKMIVRVEELDGPQRKRKRST